MELTVTLTEPGAIGQLLRARAAAGAALLDVRKSNWPEHAFSGPVRAADVDQADPAGNILAQVYGTYTAGRRALGLSPRQADSHGFTPCGDATPVLNQAWQTELQRRRG